MKMHIRNLSLLPALLVGLALVLPARLKAQTFTTLHNFSGSDGAYPWAGMTLLSNTLYGTAVEGGAFGGGTVFGINTDGSGFENLYSFAALNPATGTNSDGADPGGVVISGSTLYGTTGFGGISAVGTLFGVNTDGSGFAALHNFSWGSDGAGPSGVVISGSTLYGTTAYGGSLPYGTVFAVNTNGTGFTTLHNFGLLTDGSSPISPLVLSGNTLYGATKEGGSSDNGTVFAVKTNGTGFTVLHRFAASSTNSSGLYTNSDGASPVAGLVFSGNTVYGTALHGGSSGIGTVFKLSTGGTNFTNLHTFTGSDGFNPEAGLILSVNTLYGTTRSGGGSGNGTVFKLNTDGTGFTLLYSFTAGSGSYPNITNGDGLTPIGSVILSGNTLYGTTSEGGSAGYGTVFSLSLAPPQLAIIPSGPNVILTWPTNATGYRLQSTTNLGSSAVWTTNTPAPVIVNDQNVVTNPISGTRMFFRLSQ